MNSRIHEVICFYNIFGGSNHSLAVGRINHSNDYRLSILLNSNEFFTQTPPALHHKKPFGSPFSLRRLANNPPFEGVSFLGPTSSLNNKSFLATFTHFQFETFNLALLKARGRLGPHSCILIERNHDYLALLQ
jgi:hypothetical protein